MRRLREIKHRLPENGSKKSLYTMAFMVLFFIFFDGIVMYLAPVVMQNVGVSLGTIGLILGLSSVAGMFFDVILLRLLEKTSYRLIFLYMFLAALTVPYFLFSKTTITFYLLAMAAWGLYYNLYFIGSLDYIRQTAGTDEHTSSFGVLKVFEGLGYLVAPFFGSLILLTITVIHPVPVWLFVTLGIAFVLFLIICFQNKPTKKKIESEPKKQNPLSTIAQLHIWKKIGKVIFPLLFLTLIINLVDAAIWTIGPLFSESLSIPGGLTGGAFMLAYTIPPLIVGWFVGSLVRKIGMKVIGIGSLLVGSVILIVVGLLNEVVLLTVAIFFVSVFFSLIWPTINGAFEDTISESPDFHEEIETIGDWFTNIGDTLGPIMGGYAAQFFGIRNSFVIMGIFGTLAALVLLRFTTKGLIARISN